MENKIRDKNTEFLIDCLMAIDNREDCYAFIEDLCTIPEIKAMSQRVEVAKMLSDKKVYSEIVEATGASTATISRVNRSLAYGADGYAHVFAKLKK